MGRPKSNGEQTPLLRESRDVEHSAPTGTTNRLKARVIGTLCLIIAIYYVGAVTFTVPLNSLMEEYICKQRFGDLEGSLDRCKDDDEVSARLAYIDGWNGTLALLPALVFSVPYGLLADKWGRRKTFFLTNVGLAFFMAHSAVVGRFFIRSERARELTIQCASSTTLTSGGFGHLGSGSSLVEGFLFLLRRYSRS